MTNAELLQHIAIVSYRQADQILQERLGIGMSQYKIMAFLEEKSGSTQRDIAHTLGQTEASISRQTKLMAKNEWLITRAQSQNRRARSASLTTKGTKLLRAAQEILEALGQTMYSTLTPKQTEQLAAILTTLHIHTCAPEKSHTCMMQET